MDKKGIDSATLLHIMENILPNNVQKYVIAADQMRLVSFKLFPIVIIQNTDNSNSAGEHWISYYIPSK